MTKIETELQKSGGPSVDFILSHDNYLKGLYATRNSEYNTLRNLFDGDFASIQEDKTKPLLMQDRIKVAYNIINATTRRYMDSVSTPPKVEGLPRGFDVEDIFLADKRTKFLQHIYHANNFPLTLVMAGFYQSLLDKAIFHVRPAPQKAHKISIELGIPEAYCPMPAGDNWFDSPFDIYSYKKFDGMQDLTLDPLKTKPQLAFNSIVEFWSDNWFIKVCDGKEELRINHNWGFKPWFIAHNIALPHRYRGQGDCDQAIGLNSYLNIMFSDMADIINYAANPIAVVRGSKAGGSNLPFAPRAVWELERDAQVGFLQWTGTPPAVETQILRTIQAIEDMTGVSSPAFGREIPSGASGSAIRSLLAGFNTRLGTKQQMLGEAMTRMNMAIQCIAEKEFPNERFEIVGEVMNPKTGVPQTTAFMFQPKEMKGWYKNQVVFQPLDPTAVFFQEVEKMKGGLQSKYTTMKNLGVDNISDEYQRMAQEAAQNAEQANNMALAGQGQLPQPVIPGQTQEEAMAQLSDLHKNPNKYIPEDILNSFKKHQQPSSEPSAAPAMANNEVTMDELQSRLGQNPDLQGVEVGGELAKLGKTSGPIQLTIENPAQEPTVRQALKGLGQVEIRYRNTVEGPKPPNAPLARGLLQRPRAEVRRLDDFVTLMATQVDKTNTGAFVATVAAKDTDGGWVMVGKTQPQNRVPIKQGELVVVHINGLSKVPVEDGFRLSLVEPQPIKARMTPTKPDDVARLTKLFDEGTPANG